MTSPKDNLIIVFVKYRDTFLILKRSDKTLFHKGLWTTLQFETSETQIRESIVDEITNSLNIEPNQIKDIIQWGAYTFHNTEKMYCVAKIDTPFLDISWEYESYEWIQFRSIGTYETVPHLKEDMEYIKNL